MATIEDKVLKAVADFLDEHRSPQKIKKRRVEELYEVVQDKINGSAKETYNPGTIRNMTKRALREKKYYPSGNNYLLQE